MDKSYLMKRLCFALSGLLLIGIIIYGGFRILEATVFLDKTEKPAELTRVSKTIEKDGIKYFPKQDIETFLVLTVDEEVPAAETPDVKSTVVADALSLMVFDRTKEKVDVIMLNRNIMADMQFPNSDGEAEGLSEVSLGQSYTYGNRPEKRALYTKQAVSNLLMGIEIDHYVSLDMEAIKTLNDAVEGVSVEVWDDFSAVDSAIYQGLCTLHGDHALNFIRVHQDAGEYLNATRPDRQAEYMECLFRALKYELSAKPEFAPKLYEKVEQHMVTDCVVTALVSMLERYHRYKWGDFIVPEGEAVEVVLATGETHEEFHLDEEAFEQMVLEKFYAEKKM